MVDTVVFDRLPLVGGYISGEFRETYDLGDGKYEHGGADLLKVNGPTLGAEVVNPDAVPGRAKVHAVNHGDGDYGNHVIRDHQGTYEWSLYGHLKEFAKGLRVWQLLDPGDLMGYAGETGKATGPHLHWEAVSNKDAPTFGAIRTAPDASGVRRLVPGITLRNPRDFLRLVIGPIPTTPGVTLGDVNNSLTNLSNVVGADRLAGIVRDEALAAKVEEIGGQTRTILNVLDAIRNALPKG